MRRGVSFALSCLFLASCRPTQVETGSHDSALINVGTAVIEPPPGGRTTNGIAWGDYDGDGDLDLAVANLHSYLYVEVYENLGGGVFTRSFSDDDLTGEGRAVAWGDFDADGYLDLAVARYGESDRVFRYDSAQQTFVQVWDSMAQEQTVAIGWADYDGEGHLDLAIALENATNEVLKYEANPGPSWSKVNGWTFPNVSISRDLAWGDLDNDGDPDLVFANQGTSYAYFNLGAGVFSIGYSLPVADATSVSLGDWDQDGDLDMAFGADQMPMVSVLSNDSIDFILMLFNTTTVFSDQVSSAPTVAVDWGDYDADGDLDLVVGKMGASDQLFTNDLMMLAEAGWPSSPIRDTRDIAFGESNGDAALDVAAGYFPMNEATTVFRNDGVGFSEVANPGNGESSGNASNVAWGDADNDADADLVVALANGLPDLPELVLYYADPTLDRLEHSNTVQMTFPADDLAWGDWDNDNVLELAVAHQAGPNEVYENTSTPDNITLSLAWTSMESESTRALAWGDWDLDGDLDLIVANWGTANRIHLGQPGGLAVGPAAISTAETDETNGLALGDYDGDGDLDVVFANGNEPCRLYRNVNGTPVLVMSWSPPNANSTSAAFGDYDGDGDLDLYIGNEGGDDHLFENLGGMLDDQNILADPVSGITRAVAWVDYDGDGDLDLMTGGGDLHLLANVDGTLEHFWQSTINPDVFDIDFADGDGDGDPDLAAATAGPGLVLSRNFASIPNAPMPLLPDALVTPKVWQKLTPQVVAPIASGYALPQKHASPVQIHFSLTDDEDDPVKSVSFEYSLQGGGRWLPATTTPAAQTGVTDGSEQVVGWDAAGDGADGSNVAIRMIVRPNATTISSSHQRPELTLTTPTFRVAVADSKPCQTSFQCASNYCDQAMGMCCPANGCVVGVDAGVDAGTDSGGPTPLDAGADGGPTSLDAGADGGPTPIDSGTDAGGPTPLDAGGDGSVPVADAGSTEDARPGVDAGPGSDSGASRDAGASSDAGVTGDSGTFGQSDSGRSDATVLVEGEPRTSFYECDCDATHHDRSSAGWLLAAPMFLLLRGRRRRLAAASGRNRRSRTCSAGSDPTRNRPSGPARS